MAILGSWTIFYGFVYFTAMVIFRKPMAKEGLLDKTTKAEESELVEFSTKP